VALHFCGRPYPSRTLLLANSLEPGTPPDAMITALVMLWPEWDYPRAKVRLPDNVRLSLALISGITVSFAVVAQMAPRKGITSDGETFHMHTPCRAT